MALNEVHANIEENLPTLKRYALSLVRDPTQAEDLVQECAAKALAKAHLYTPNTNLRAWLYTILHNQFVTDCRRQSTTPSGVDPDMGSKTPAVTANQSFSYMIGTVEQAIAKLPSDQATILWLAGIEGWSYREISGRLGLPVGTVKSRCSRAREALQSILHEQDPAHLRPDPL